MVIFCVQSSIQTRTFGKYLAPLSFAITLNKSIYIHSHTYIVFFIFYVIYFTPQDIHAAVIKAAPPQWWQ